MPPSGDSRPQRVPPIPPRPSRNTYPTLAMCSTGSTSYAGSPKASPWYDERYNTATPSCVPQRSNRTCLRARFTLLRRTDHLTEAHQAHLNRIFDAHPRLRTAWDALQELSQLYEADNPDQANQALGRFADLYATGQTPRIPPSCRHHHRMGRTDRDLGLPHHPTGIQRTHRRNQHTSTRVLRRVAHGFTNPNNYAA